MEYPKDQALKDIFAYAPKDILYLLLLKVHPRDLQSFCSVNKRVSEICRSDIFRIDYFDIWEGHEDVSIHHILSMPTISEKFRGTLSKKIEKSYTDIRSKTTIQVDNVQYFYTKTNPPKKRFIIIGKDQEGEKKTFIAEEKVAKKYGIPKEKKI